MSGAPGCIRLVSAANPCLLKRANSGPAPHLEPGPDLAPGLTLVITSYDRPAALERAVRSAAAQRALHAIVVVDDASPAVTPADLERLAGFDGRIRVLRHQVNQGVCAARNTGLAATRTQYVTFLDDDDTLPPRAFRATLRRYRWMRPARRARAVVVGTVAVERNGKIRERRRPPSSRPGEIWGLDADLLRGRHRSFACKQSAVDPTATLRSVGGWDAQLRSRSQTELFFRICQVCHVVGQRRVTYHLNRDPAERLTLDATRREASYAYIVRKHAALLTDASRRRTFEGIHQAMLAGHDDA